MSDAVDPIMIGAGDAPTEEQRNARSTELRDVRAMLESPAARRFLWRLLERCGIYRSSFTGGDATFFNEGVRDTGLFVLHEITEADPSAYAKMMLERNNDDG